MYREKVYEWDIVRIEKTDGRLVFYHNENRPEIMVHSDLLGPFPDHLFETLDDKKSLLAYCSCDAASAWLHDIIKYLLLGKSCSAMPRIGVEAVQCTPGVSKDPETQRKELTILLRHYNQDF